MHATAYAGEHKGHRLVERKGPRGERVYRVPERYAGKPVSECIRGLAGEGWSRAEISKVTGILYQHVRNVLEGNDPVVSGSVGASPDDGGGTGGTAVEADRVGSVVAFGDLVARVERGTELTVTRDGVPVAQIVPWVTAQRMAAVRQAMARMDEIRARTSLAGLDVEDLIDEGRP